MSGGASDSAGNLRARILRRVLASLRSKAVAPVTALSDALTAAQRSALAALEKAYVAGVIDVDDLKATLESFGISDPIDVAFLCCALDVLKDWGVSAPNLTERLARENGEPEKASDKQRALIMDLCRRKEVPAPDLAGLTKPKASELIDSLNDGSYDPAQWSVPF